MAYTLREDVRDAIAKLYLHPHTQEGEQALEMLEEVAEQGDKDAYYLLGRCYAGPSFISSVHGFFEDHDKAREYFYKSTLHGSALGILGYMRISSKNNYVLYPPYESIQRVWEDVYSLAEQNDIFAQMLIANAYYYEDVAIIFEEGRIASCDPAAYERLAYEWMKKAISLYENCIDHGLTLVIGNLIQLYTKGMHGLPIQPHKELELWRRGASMKDGRYEAKLGVWCSEHGQHSQAAGYFESAYQHGNLDGLYHLAEEYTFRGGLPLDLLTACKCLEECLAKKHQVLVCHNMLGEIYVFGGSGVMVDYEKAFYHLQSANQIDYNIWASDLLGTCYLKVLGTKPDYQKAMQLFEMDVSKPMSCIGIGEIYAYGLGVKQDIRSAMIYWSNHPKDERVLANKKNFKRTIFGWKQLHHDE